MAALASDWLRHFPLLLWNHWTEFNKTWQEARSQRPLPSLCFSGWSEKQDGRPGLWLAETFSTSPLKPLNGIQRILTGSKISTSSTKFVFFGPIGKTRWRPWPLIDWDIFDFSSETAERNSTKLYRKQDLNVLYQVCVFRADRKKKMATLANPPKRWHIVLRCTICGPLGLLFCTQISETFSNQTISTSIICVSVLVSSLINKQKQNMINNFHVWVKTGKQRNIRLLENVIHSSQWRYRENHILYSNSHHYLSIRSGKYLLVLNKILEPWLNIRTISLIQLLSLKRY